MKNDLSKAEKAEMNKQKFVDFLNTTETISEDVLEGKSKPRTINLHRREIDGESREWRQLYLKDDAERSEYPEYLFLSNDGNMISWTGKYFRLLRGENTYRTGRKDYIENRYRYIISINGKRIKKFASRLVQQIFGSQSYGKADTVHHINNKPYDNRPENLRSMPKAVHDALSNIKPYSENITQEEHDAGMKADKNLFDAISKEGSELPTVVMTELEGQEYNRDVFQFTGNMQYKGETIKWDAGKKTMILPLNMSKEVWMLSLMQDIIRAIRNECHDDDDVIKEYLSVNRYIYYFDYDLWLKLDGTREKDRPLQVINNQRIADILVRGIEIEVFGVFDVMIKLHKNLDTEALPF